MASNLRLLVIAALVLFGLCASGCGRKASALNGKWKVDGDKMLSVLKEQEGYKKLPDAMKGKFEDDIKKKFETVTFTFADPKMTVTNMGPGETEATYKVKEMKGDTWEIETTGMGGKTATWSLTWVSDDAITLTPPKTGGPVEIAFHLIRQK